MTALEFTVFQIQTSGLVASKLVESDYEILKNVEIGEDEYVERGLVLDAT